MITSNNVRLPIGERKKLKILTTNNLKRKTLEEEGISRPATKVNGRILQAGRVPDEDPGARTIDTIAAPGRRPIVLKSVAIKKKATVVPDEIEKMFPPVKGEGTIDDGEARKKRRPLPNPKKGSRKGRKAKAT